MMHFFERIPYYGESEFTLLSFEHFLTAVIVVLLVVCFYFISPRLKKWKSEWILRYSFALFMLLSQITIFKYNYDSGYMWYNYLPEATCGWAIYFGALSLITKNRTFTVLTFFWGWGAISTILFPNILEGPTRYNFYQFFARHILILFSSIYMFRVFDFKLHKRDFLTYVYWTLPMTIIGGILSFIVNKPDQLNMFYMLQPASNTPLFGTILEYSYPLYIIIWLSFATLVGYIYGLPFYQKKEK